MKEETIALAGTGFFELSIMITILFHDRKIRARLTVRFHFALRLI